MANILHFRNLDANAPNMRPAPYWLKRNKILEGVSGYASSGPGPEGGLVALMGASGSGKSTLLNFIAGRAKPDAGELMLNGAAYDEHTSTVVGFVPQSDQLFATLSVMETLRLHASLRGVAAASASRLSEILASLGLADSAETRVGEPGASGRRAGLSGGERKRLSIALELLHSPPLLVMDEPTSGLDSAGAFDVLNTLSALASKQAVVISLHQPAARCFRLVAQLGLLSPVGKMVFFGRSADAVAHFTSLGAPLPPQTSPPEHYLDVLAERGDLVNNILVSGVSQVSLDSVIRAQREMGGGGGGGAKGAVRRGASFARQVGELLWRANVNNQRHPAFLRAMLSRSLAMSLIVGHLFSGLGHDQASVQDRVGALYFVLTNQIMSSSGSMRTFLVEREIARHELDAGLYTLPAYFLARSLAESVWQLAAGALFATLTYYLVGFAPTAEQFLVFVLVVTLVTLCAESYVVLVGAAMPDEKSAAVVSPLVLALFMVSGGLFVNAAKLPALFRGLNRINMFSYAFSALLQNEMTGLELSCEEHELVGSRRSARQCPIESGEQVVERMAMGERTIEENVIALLAIFGVFRLLAFLVLRRRFGRK